MKELEKDSFAVIITRFLLALCIGIAACIAFPLTLLIGFPVLLVVGGLFALCGSKGWDNTINQVER